MPLYRIIHTVSCDNTYYVDIPAESREEAEDIFNSGYWDIGEIVSQACLDPIIDEIIDISEEEIEEEDLYSKDEIEGSDNTNDNNDDNGDDN